MNENKLEILYRTNPDILARAAARGEVKPQDATRIQDTTVGAYHLIAAAVARAEARAQDAGLTPEGKQREQAKDGAATAAALLPFLATTAAEARKHQEFVARAPHLEPQADGTLRDVRETRAHDDPTAALLRHEQDRDGWAFLRAMSPSDRGAYLRERANGADPDGLLAAALRAPSYLDLVDDRTRAHVVAMRLRRRGLDTSIAQSAFTAARFAQLEDGITASLDALGVPAERPATVRI